MLMILFVGILIVNDVNVGFLMDRSSFSQGDLLETLRDVIHGLKEGLKELSFSFQH
jgi:hypothetical protein